MAEPSVGTYSIVSVGSGKAIDVPASSDKKGANVQMWDQHLSDGQIWALSKPEGDSFQIFCSLTGKCLDILNGNLVSGENVRQWDDNNSKKAQRWTIETDDLTYVYKGVEYPSYTIRPFQGQTLALDVKWANIANGANVWIYNVNGSRFQRWILLPTSAFTEDGTYEIVLARDTSMCAEVAASSTANGANLHVGSRADANNQIFKASVNQETQLVRFFNANSKKVIDVKDGNGKRGQNLQQFSANNTAAQNWLPVPNGTVVINGVRVPTYELRAQVGNALNVDCAGGGYKSGTNIQLYDRNNSIAQRFAFVKNEMTANDAEMPGKIMPELFSREGFGEIEVKDLVFRSTQLYFQARYKIRTYGETRASYTETKWMSILDNATSRAGWGDAWSWMFQDLDGNGSVAFPFERTFELTEEHRFIDIYIETRAYLPAYTDGYKAHTATQSTTIQLYVEPRVYLSSVHLTQSSLKDTLGLRTILGLEGAECQYMRAQWIGADGEPFSDNITSSSLSILHSTAENALYSLPELNEECHLNYEVQTKTGLYLTGSLPWTFDLPDVSVVDMATDADISVTYPDDGAFCAQLSANVQGAMCLMEIDGPDHSKLVSCPNIGNSQAGEQIFRACAPLNKDVRVIFAKYTADGTTFSIGNVHIKSHLFIWNWTRYLSKDYLADSAAVIVNNGAPPAQTRTFTANEKFNSPIGRIYPVGHAGKDLTAALDIDGVVIDEDAIYVAAGPIPDITSSMHIRKLILLSGLGIHPYYRTPFGDWFQVAVEKVDLSKTALNLSTAKVTQQAVED